MKIKALFLSILLLAAAYAAFAQTTEFTYQGRLVDGTLPANASYDFEFRLFPVASGGTAAGTLARNGVLVSDGNFTVTLDFGPVFQGQPFWLEIAVKPAGGPMLQLLSPRQAIASVPYAVRSLNSTAADESANALQLGGVNASQYVVTTDPRMTNARNPLPGSTGYIQNSTFVQNATFSITGNASANIMSAAQFNYGAFRLMGIGPGSNTVFVGLNAGGPGGTDNSYFGTNTGNANSTGAENSFFGSSAGRSNSTGSRNAFFGFRSGDINTQGNDNSIFGRSAGLLNMTASFNSFFGSGAGQGSTTSENSFFGYRAGATNSSASGNSFFGYLAGEMNTGGANSFFGEQAGKNNSGNTNSFFGSFAGTSNGTGAGNSFFGWTAGQANTDGFQNTFIGIQSGKNNTSGSFNSFFGSGSGRANTTGVRNVFIGQVAGEFNTLGQRNTFVGAAAGQGSLGSENTYLGASAGIQTTTGSGNTFIGSSAGSANTSGNLNTIIGRLAAVGSSDLSYATAIGAEAVVNASNTIVLGRNFTNPSGSLGDDVVVYGFLRATLSPAGGSIDVCQNAATFIFSSCSSSLRYKTDVRAFTRGLDVVRRLKPIAFDWESGGRRDVGFAAEDVAAVEPLLAIHGDTGEIEGVKYKQITTVLVNAVNEQQAQIETQRKMIDEQQKRIEELKQLVCATNPKAKLCREERK